ncbi:SAM-dependent methyltransferase [Allostreptomyces psammosilenae]|uniref:SAM-dependent methyltransferase n=1 Tax=Allostreptomyces psammosilenae TaxID=1892865 RepID=A0A852ZVM3_9ACTN|nr:SAM-dependent methyltransferase [Allostreptomyces psammosilenae]NYI06443.1 SAM-dependent methyltransferase [Allostreptomyces psammosilenae]
MAHDAPSQQVPPHTATAPTGIDTSIAHPARVYDYWLGGKDNFASDREVAEKVIAALPEAKPFAQANRAFLGHAVRHVAERGIRQYLDIGPGLPTANNTHEVARSVVPDAQVVYVDNDPIVLTHARALLEQDASAGRTTVLPGDLRRPEEFLEAPELRAALDFDQPVAVLMVAVLHFLADSDEPHRIVEGITRLLAPGSVVVISHATVDGMDPEVARQGLAGYRATAPMVPRPKEEVARFFDGLEVLPPGIVRTHAWRPGTAEQEIDGYPGWAAIGSVPQR